ncbi:MAG: hypothetical protein QOH32_2394 [Bradyrhizobium sp.]|jgi:uncharacterized membrane protein|nr:hypothetical protein [Bradyrhizobium sp.]
MMARAGGSDNRPGGRTAARNIESILRLEEKDEQELSAFHRVSHAVGWFVGTIWFVFFQCLFVLVWLGLNTGLFGNRFSFDPWPFPLLSTVLALEAVLLTSFVLTRQNAMDLRSERRNHLNLQINLLAEKEATSILQILREIADHLNVEMSADAEHEELARDTPVESIARDLRSREKKS